MEAQFVEGLMVDYEAQSVEAQSEGPEGGAWDSRRPRELEAPSVGGLENGGQESGRPSEWEVKMVECQ